MWNLHVIVVVLFKNFSITSFWFILSGLIFFDGNIILFLVMDMTGGCYLLPISPWHFILSNIFSIYLYQCIRSSPQIIPKRNKTSLNGPIKELQKKSISISYGQIKDKTNHGIFTETWWGMCQLISKWSHSKMGW